jgi:hypothetical protein
MKYYNFDTMFISLKQALQKFLYDNNITFEISKNYEYYHFEILTDSDGAKKINNFIDSITIWNRGVV